jgi:putative transport protein
MPWLQQLFQGSTIAGTVVVLSLVALTGLVFGSLKIKGIGLGLAGVLFSGLIFGHLKFSINPEMMEFAREFGLILFVYSIGLQVGPGIWDSLRREGLPLNLCAIAIVCLGTLTAVVLGKFFNLPIPVVVGILCGATTNTPSLGSAQAALTDAGASMEVAGLPGLGYAVAYPFGIVGIILSMLFLRLVFRIKLDSETKAFQETVESGAEQLGRINLVVQNPNLEGMQLSAISLFEESGVIISRVQHDGKQIIATPETRLFLGDIVLAVGPTQKLHALKLLIGERSPIDLLAAPSNISHRKMIVTQKNVLGKTLRELSLHARFNVRVTRLVRAGVEMPVSPVLKLQYGDTVMTVGDQEQLEQAAGVLGNSVKALNHPEVLPVFIGILLGVIAGSIPLAVPGVPAPVKLGLAGGPLLAAIILSQVGNVGPIVWYLPGSANLLMRELGIALFLACVGLKAGGQLAQTLVEGNGVLWLGIGAAITVIPLLVVGTVARMFMKTNFLAICGMLSGSMTDPPALAFASNIAGSDAPTIAYATVYPLSMILRIILAQLLILFLT